MTRKTELIRKLHDRSPRNRYAEAEAEARAGREILIKQYGSEGKLAHEVRASIWRRVRRADTAQGSRQIPRGSARAESQRFRFRQEVMYSALAVHGRAWKFFRREGVA